MIVTALVENDRVSEWPGLRTELGLAIHIDGPRLRILFDAGASDALIHNARALGVDLAGIDAVVVSHGHYDHFNGLAGFFGLNDRARVHMHARAAAAYYIKPFGAFRKYIGVDRALHDAYKSRIEHVSETIEIADGVFILTDLSRKHPLPPDQRLFFVEEQGTLLPDVFHHEIILVIREENGLIVFAGGCHVGILNAVASVRERFPGCVIRALFSGFHAVRLPFFGIMPGGKVDIPVLAGQLNERGDVKKFYTCHSTSRNVFMEMKRVLGERLAYLAAGCRVEV